MSELKNDMDLINQIKTTQDSNALTELANRHTGIYMMIINQYAKSITNTQELEDLREEKDYYIYKWSMKFDPSRNMKFSTYIGENTKFLCKNLIRSMTNKPIFETEDALYNMSDDCDFTTLNCDQNDIEDMLHNEEDGSINKIIEMRNSGHTWKEVGSAINMSYEGARKKYIKYIDRAKMHLDFSETINEYAR